MIQVSHLVRAYKSQIITSSPIISSSSDDIHKRYSFMCQSLQDRQLPSPSGLLPLGKVSSQTLRSRRLKKFLFYDLSSGIAASNVNSPASTSTSKQLLTWIDYQIGTSSTSSSHIINSLGSNVSTSTVYSMGVYPVIVLSYADILEMSETVSLLLTTKGDAIIVFVPHFCQGKSSVSILLIHLTAFHAGTVAKEIVRCLDTWGPVSVTTSPAPAPSIQLGQMSLTPGLVSAKNSTRPVLNIAMDRDSFSPGSSSMDSPSSNTSRRSTITTGAVISEASLLSGTGAGVGSQSGVYEPSDVDLSSKTLAYHSVMDTVTRLQNELAVPIIVFT